MSRDDGTGPAVAGVTSDLDQLSLPHPVERIDDQAGRLIRVHRQSEVGPLDERGRR